MFQYLTDISAVETARNKIAELFDAHAEWFCIINDGNSQALFRQEIELSCAQGRLILSCWSETGTRFWRIHAWSWTGAILQFQASRRMGAERTLIELIPRASATVIAATIRAARQVRCDHLAQMASSLVPGARIERSALSPGVRRGQPGRFARVLLRQRHRRIAVTGSVITSHAGEVDAFLSAALLWFFRSANRIHPPQIEQLWLVVEEPQVKALLQRLVLFREQLKTTITVYSLDQQWTTLTPHPIPERLTVLKRPMPRFPPVAETLPSRLATEIIVQAPECIDVVHSRYGETLRYLGLPFARVRRVAANENLWFGVDESRRRLLDQNNFDELALLLDKLHDHRSATAADRHHALYRAASEAWLESILRRDITRLDPGLLIAPLHAQFRTSRGGRPGVRPVDLLALRQDGRLVVIELKVFEDREHVLQGADYWLRVETHRRRSHISKARLFGDLKISDESPLVYLVTPTLRVHPAFETLARCLARDIEIYRFDINEDWRAGVRVMRRLRVN